jgi:hypothetical protein
MQMMRSVTDKASTSSLSHYRPTTAYPMSSRVTGTDAVLELMRTQRPNKAWVGLPLKEQLERALQRMANAGQQEPFLGRFLIMQEHSMGGQARVQFARGGDGGFFQYAIKCAPFSCLCKALTAL